EMNVFGVMTVTRALLPTMRTAGHGRIVNLSSMAGKVALPLLTVYASTKHAVEGFSESLRWELEPFGIDVCLVEPGTFKTPFFTNRRHKENAAKNGPYAAVNEAVEKIIDEEAEKAPPPDAVGQAIARLLGETSPR